MNILIGYATTEGQTRRIARHAARRLAAAGHGVEIMPLTEADPEALAGCDAVILAGSIHAGRYQAELRDFARDNVAALAARRTLFLSVSLSAAGSEAEDWQGLEEILARFVEETGWTPDRVEQVAGAFRFSQYDFFRYWAMRWIAAHRDESVTPGEDVEYTDWAALDAALDDWARLG
ncbi:protoporphyrinogen oxidase [Rhodobacteraceae bacterium WD3A24]|nr:protoporphyrinogen oxidase [Rhodobacteraceae bacterium WD3A24]